jgi:hypothetical protein
MPPENLSPLRLLLPAVLDECVELRWTLMPEETPFFMAQAATITFSILHGMVSLAQATLYSINGVRHGLRLEVCRGLRRAETVVCAAGTPWHSLPSLTGIIKQRTPLFSDADLVALAPYLEAMYCIQWPDPALPRPCEPYTGQPQPAHWSLYKSVHWELFCKAPKPREKALAGLVTALGPPPWNLNTRPPWSRDSLLKHAVQVDHVDTWMVPWLVLAGAKPQHGLRDRDGSRLMFRMVVPVLPWRLKVKLALLLLLGACASKPVWETGVGWRTTEWPAQLFLVAWPKSCVVNWHKFHMPSTARQAWLTWA